MSENLGYYNKQKNPKEIKGPFFKNISGKIAQLFSTNGLGHYPPEQIDPKGSKTIELSNNTLDRE